MPHNPAIPRFRLGVAPPALPDVRSTSPSERRGAGHRPRQRDVGSKSRPTTRAPRRALFAAIAVALSISPARAEISFDRDVRPILSENCYLCHGPDESSREADLRLDLRESALADLGGYAAIVPGDPDESELYLRVASDEASYRMPPPSSGKTLSPEQIETLRAWIGEGAPYAKHWAFVPPERPAVPATAPGEVARNAIDAFVLARLRTEGLAPSPEADAPTLLRRLSLDLTGLPPSLEDLDRFLAEARTDPDRAYADAVERLLASPHYAERRARLWLDAAQYADSDGFEKDKPREVWAWRDWVVRAFDANMPYDRFLREQIAGDMLPGADRDRIVATGFLRNGMINEEGGADPEQFRMEAIFGRMDVLGQAALGLTLRCAQCHTHKYDPLTHTDYFRLMAYLNNSHEAQVTVYSDEELARREAALARQESFDAQLKEGRPGWREEMAEWEARVLAQPQPDWRALELSFDDSTAGGQKCLPLGDGSYIASGYAPTRHTPKMAGPSPVRRATAIRLELLTDPNLPRGGPGRSIFGSAALTEFQMHVAPEERPFETMDQWERVEIASAIADVDPPKRALGHPYHDGGKRKAFTGPIGMAIDGEGETAWTTDDGPERRNRSRVAIFKLARPIEIPEGGRIGIKLQQNHGGSNSDNNENYNIGRFRISVADADALPEFVVPEDVRAIVAKPSGERSPEEATRVFRYWRSTRPEFAAANRLADMAWEQHPEGTTQLVYRERETPRPTHRLERGDFLQPKERVEPGVPDFLNPMPEGAPPDRRGLAAWLTDRRAPTTARVFVNRVWQSLFGTGLVDTPSDFGLQGSAPSHPELLDWLAVEFMDSGWDAKALHRLIVSSAAYRQSSRVSPELLERDPANRLLARGARFRTDAEVVRDVALAASGLLDRRVGGPPVHPPAPEFLFRPPASYGPKVWNVAEGGDRYRRALYTFRFRSVPYPALHVFDAPDAAQPCVRRERSNTPLQALTLLNEPLFVECARALATRAMGEAEGAAADPAGDAERVALMFRLCTAREPDPEETRTLVEFVAKQRERIASGELDAAAILARPEGEPADAEAAAWTLAARVALSLDETLTRE